MEKYFKETLPNGNIRIVTIKREIKRGCCDGEDDLILDNKIYHNGRLIEQYASSLRRNEFERCCQITKEKEDAGQTISSF